MFQNTVDHSDGRFHNTVLLLNTLKLGTLDDKKDWISDLFFFVILRDLCEEVDSTNGGLPGDFWE